MLTSFLIAVAATHAVLLVASVYFGSPWRQPVVVSFKAPPGSAPTVSVANDGSRWVRLREVGLRDASGRTVWAKRMDPMPVLDQHGVECEVSGMEIRTGLLPYAVDGWGRLLGG